MNLRPPRRFYEFASFRLDATERQLWRDGQPVPLTPKVFDILLALVENSGHTLDKEELMERVWADIFVDEGNLNRNISTLRKVLGDDSHRQQFIKTIPKQGYRFTAGVREVLENEEEILVEDKTRFQLEIWEEIRETGKLRKGVREIFYRIFESPRLRVVPAVFILLLFGAAAAWIWNRSEQNEASVLPPVKGAQNAEAFELYQKGRALWQTRDGKDLHEATLLLEEAVRKDPNFAPAHGALADAYAFDFNYWKKVEAEAREAIRLDPDLGEPHASLGFVKMFWEWKFEEAEREFKQAIQLNPNYATAHQWYAVNLFASGVSGHAAYVEMSKALELEPNSLSINADMCQTLYFLRRYDEAIAQCRKTLAMDDKFYNAHHYLYQIYNAGGMYPEAVETYFKMEELLINPAPPDVQAKLREAYQTGGIRAFWKTQIELLWGKIPAHYRVAQNYARLGETEKAVIHLQKALETRDFEFFLVLPDPVFDDLPQVRSSKNFKELTDLLSSGN